MQVSIDTKLFKTAFDKAKEIVPTASPVEAILGVKLVCSSDGTASLTGTNLYVWITCLVEGVEVDEPGEVIIPAKFFADVLSKLGPDDTRLVLSLDNNRLIVRGKKVKWNQAVYPVSSFQDLPAYNVQPLVRINADSLIKCLKHTCYIPNDSVLKGWSLGGLLVEWNPEDGEMALVACDGRRTARSGFPAEILGPPPTSPYGPIIHSMAGNLLAKILKPEFGNVEIGFGFVAQSTAPNVVVFSTLKEVVVTSIETGSFPPYRDAIASYPVTNTYLMPLVSLKQSIEQVAIGTSETTRRIELEFSTDGLKISLPNNGESEADARLEATHIGNPIKSAFDHRYLVSALKSVDADAIDVDICGMGGPLIYRADGFMYMALSITGGN